MRALLAPSARRGQRGGASRAVWPLRGQRGRSWRAAPLCVMALVASSPDRYVTPDKEVIEHQYFFLFSDLPPASMALVCTGGDGRGAGSNHQAMGDGGSDLR